MVRARRELNGAAGNPNRCRSGATLPMALAQHAGPALVASSGELDLLAQPDRQRLDTLAQAYAIDQSAVVSGADDEASTQPARTEKDLDDVGLSVHDVDAREAPGALLLDALEHASPAQRLALRVFSRFLVVI